MTYILGINAYHGDSAACLLKSGELIAAAEEERFRRVKHWAGFPSNAIKYCLEETNVSLNSVQHLAINRDPKANLWKKLKFTLSKRPDFRLIIDRLKNAKQWSSIENQLKISFPESSFTGEVHHIEHHLAHLASVYYTAPCDKAVCVSIDGFGDFASAAWGTAEATEIKIDDKVYFPHSLGIFYQALTQYIGFPHFGDEYKVMGLAPYGEPKHMEEMRQIVHLLDDGSFRLNLDYFRHHREKIEYEWEDGTPKVGELYSSNLKNLLGPLRREKDPLTKKHKDIARSVQGMFEEALFHLLNNLHQKYQLDVLTLSGGCAMNSVANGKVYANTPFRKLYLPASAGDAGGAIGVAYYVWQQLNSGAKAEPVSHAYWGPNAKPDEIRLLLEEHRSILLEQNCTIHKFDDESELCNFTAKQLIAGYVVGWFQGRMEWGPRALGNRSILGDPRRKDMKEILNLKIKRRESFRPFAPSILREHVSQWFDIEDDVPYMMKVFQVKQEKRKLIPAVTHVDGSGRLQTVTPISNSRYYQLIKSFYTMTDVPMLLNTSFNENEPIVCKPKEALDCFLRTKMDLLVLNNVVIQRQSV